MKMEKTEKGQRNCWSKWEILEKKDETNLPYDEPKILDLVSEANIILLNATTKWKLKPNPQLYS